MRLPVPLFAPALLALLSLPSSSAPGPQEPSQPKPAAAASAAYPNNPDGLRQLLSNLIETAKAGDSLKLHEQIVALEIPRHETWFAQTFGPDEGQKAEALYSSSLAPTSSFETQFQMLCEELSKEQGEISIQKVDTAKRYRVLAAPLDEYGAEWKKTGDSPGPDRQSIGDFFFVDGTFRLNASPHQIRILSKVKPGPVVVGKLINRVQPVYPKQATALHIQGLVSLNVIIHKDGTVTVLNVGAGHPLLAPAAVEAVKQWLYQPTTISGEPVETETKVYVVFTLNRQSQAANP